MEYILQEKENGAVTSGCLYSDSQPFIMFSKEQIESILCQATVHFTTGKFSSPSNEKTLQQKVGAAEAIDFIAKELGIDLNEGLK